MELTWDHEIIYTPWIYQELWQIKAFLLGFPNLKTDIMNLCGDWPRSNHIYPIGSIWLGIFTYESTIKDSTKYMYFNSYKSTYNHPHGSPKTPGYIYIYTKTPFPNPKENKTHPGCLAVTGGWMNLLPPVVEVWRLHPNWKRRNASSASPRWSKVDDHHDVVSIIQISKFVY